MLCIQEINILINGLTGPGPRATGFGLFVGLLEAFNRWDEQIEKFFSSVSYHVPGSKLPLFSEVQAAFAGCCVVRNGHPETGHHGLYLSGSDKDLFVPYTFERTSLLWWVKIKRAPEATCLQAAMALDPANAPCQVFMQENLAAAATAAVASAPPGDPTGILRNAD